MPDSTFSSLQQVLEAYNPAFKTGNSALDITLGASEMLCKKNEISLTFIGDGHALDFLEAADLYSLIENALDQISALTSILLLCNQSQPCEIFWKQK